MFFSWLSWQRQRTDFILVHFLVRPGSSLGGTIPAASTTVAA
jgi:hypothetical protein